jgi:hypothetical protein
LRSVSVAFKCCFVALRTYRQSNLSKSYVLGKQSSVLSRDSKKHFAGVAGILAEKAVRQTKTSENEKEKSLTSLRVGPTAEVHPPPLRSPDEAGACVAGRCDKFQAATRRLGGRVLDPRGNLYKRVEYNGAITYFLTSFSEQTCHMSKSITRLDFVKHRFLTNSSYSREQRAFQTGDSTLRSNQTLPGCSFQTCQLSYPQMRIDFVKQSNFQGYS